METIADLFFFFFFSQYIFYKEYIYIYKEYIFYKARQLIEANVKASPWDNGSKELCPRTQRSGNDRIRTEDRLVRSPTP